MRVLLTILDAACVIVAMVFAYLAHGWLQGVVPFLKARVHFQEYVLLVYLALPLWLALIRIFKADQIAETLPRPWELALELLKVHIFGTVTIAFVAFVGQIVINRSIVLLFLVSLYLVLFAQKWAVVAYHRYQHGTGQTRERILVLGEPTEALSAFLSGVREESPPLKIVGVVSSEPPNSALPEAKELRHLGSIDRFEAVLHDRAVDRVVFLPPYNRAQDYPGTFELCELHGIESNLLVESMTPLHLTPRIEVEHDLPFMTYELAPKPAELLAVKGLMDLIISLVAVIILALPLAVISLLIRVMMGKPVLFVQDRIGFNGRIIRVFKFRTMIQGAELRRDEFIDENEMEGPVFKIGSDPRVTRLGRFLRRTSIDETPQLFNVLLGQMSLVGPRPLPVREQREIRGLYRRRLTMKPGITGLWQVSGRSEIGFDEWMELDRKYVEEWSLLLDLKILFRTIGAVLSGKGAK